MPRSHANSSARSPRRCGVWAVCLWVLALLLATHPPFLAAHPESFANVVQEAAPAVVHIRQPVNGAPGNHTRDGGAQEHSGSGFLISPDGYVVTNQHLAAHGGRLEVMLQDERRFAARVVGVDVQTDLALLKIDAVGLPWLAFGDSDAARVGDWVLAIGNPLGLSHSASAGIISAKGRNLFDEENVAYGEFMQTDAAINPGSSGGPLLNTKGQVVGVATAISREGHGIGFALPSNLVRGIVAQLKAHGRVRRGWLGVVIRPVLSGTEPALGLPAGARGLLVAEVKAGSPAQRADIRKGDVLTHYGTEPVKEVARLQKLVAATPIGASVGIRLLRKGGRGWQSMRIALEMVALPE